MLNLSGSVVEVDYVYQDRDNLPGGHKPHPDRTKPWGTSHAILVAKNKISGTIRGN
ncbi:MAG: hypothetical protein R2727_02220 [Bacteroidales bacterium]